MEEEQKKRDDQVFKFVDAALKAIDAAPESSDHVVTFTCPMCGGEAQALWRCHFKNKRTIGAAKCNGCDFKMIV
jgi:predicted RNA-binding Zn-ribbon protein involved in translation (DUF1610 family)